MPLLDYPDPANLDESTRRILDGTRNDRDEIPSFPHMLANNPAILEAALGQFGEVMYGGELDPAIKQLAFVVVSQTNACAYCAASHGEELVGRFGLPKSQLHELADGEFAGLTERQRAVADFAQQSARDPKRVSAEHLDALRAVGFNFSGILELTAVVSQAAFANTLVDALNVHPSDESPALEGFYPAEGTADSD